MSWKKQFNEDMLINDHKRLEEAENRMAEEHQERKQKEDTLTLFVFMMLPCKYREVSDTKVNGYGVHAHCGLLTKIGGKDQHGHPDNHTCAETCMACQLRES